MLCRGSASFFHFVGYGRLIEALHQQSIMVNIATGVLPDREHEALADTEERLLVRAAERVLLWTLAQQLEAEHFLVELGRPPHVIGVDLNVIDERQPRKVSRRLRTQH